MEDKILVYYRTKRPTQEGALSAIFRDHAYNSANMTGGGFIFFSELSKSSGFVAIGRTVYFSAVTLHESKVSSNMHGLSSPPPQLKAHIPTRWSLISDSRK